MVLWSRKRTSDLEEDFMNLSKDYENLYLAYLLLKVDVEMLMDELDEKSQPSSPSA